MVASRQLLSGGEEEEELKLEGKKEKKRLKYKLKHEDEDHVSLVSTASKVQCMMYVHIDVFMHLQHW